MIKKYEPDVICLGYDQGVFTENTWFREIARALESTIEVVCVRESILNGIKEKV